MAKKIVLLIVLGLAALLYYNYQQTGELTLSLHKLSPEEKELKNLERQLDEINKELASMNRTAHATGLIAPMETAGDLDQLMKQRDELQNKIDELSKKIKR